MLDIKSRNYDFLRMLNKKYSVNWSKVKALERRVEKAPCINKIRTRTAMVEIYLDDLQSLKALYDIIVSDVFPYECILHNKDVFNEDKEPDENGFGGHLKGELKKEHIHLVLCFHNAMTSSAVAKKFGFVARFVQMWNFRSEALAYLTHVYEPYKYQYKITDCYGNLDGELVELQPIIHDKYLVLDRIVKDIKNCEEYLYWSDFYEMARKSHYAYVVMKHQSFCRLLIQEHNEKLRRSTYENATISSLHEDLFNLQQQVINLCNENSSLKEDVALLQFGIEKDNKKND